METAAAELAGMKPENWPGWVVFLLELLQDKTNAGHYREMLVSLQWYITTRLQDGTW
jgi:hypothetical protein